MIGTKRGGKALLTIERHWKTAKKRRISIGVKVLSDNPPLERHFL